MEDRGEGRAEPRERLLSDELDRAIAFIVRHPRCEHLSRDHNGTTIICGVLVVVGPLEEVAPQMAELLRRADETKAPLADQMKWTGSPRTGYTPELDDAARMNPMWPDDEDER